ncbi:hypothetical protein M5689_024567 [Euphorbia peplus]|nr:hypothetical protein M5689_024567 [Euphorbia peplus]
MPPSEQEHALIIMWWLWFRRNKWVHDKIWLDSSLVIEKVDAFISDYHQAIDYHTHINPSSQIPSYGGLDSIKIWYPPSNGVVKVNCDAAWGDNGLICRVGIIARDNKGLMLASAGVPIDPCLLVEAAELQAIFHGLNLAFD